MKYTINYSKGDDICLVHVTGEIKRPDDSIKLQTLCFEHGAENDCVNYLFDMRKATLTGSIEGAYRAGASPGTKGVDPKKYKTALVYSKLLPEHRMMQLVLNEQGYAVQVFDNMDQATDWLNNEQSISS